MQEFLTMWKNYVNFSGRTTVKGYWMVILISMIINILLVILTSFADFFSIVSGLYALASMIPILALTIRRMHDINKSGWWVLLSCIPLIGQVIFLIWLCKGSVAEGNKYGAQV